MNTDTIRDTFKHTSQWGGSIDTFPMRRHLKSRSPALNVPCRHEAVAIDTVYSDTPAVDSGVKQAQLFVGKDSVVSDIYPMRSSKHLSILWKTISADAVPWTSSSVIWSKMRSPTRSRTSSGLTASMNGNHNLIIRIKILQSGGTEPSRPGLTP